MGRRKRKLRGRVRRQVLSRWDKALYGLAIVVLIVGLFMLLMGQLRLQEVIAFRQPSVIAYTPRASIFYGFPLILYLLVTFGALLSKRYRDGVPLFAPRRDRREKGSGRAGLALWCAGLVLTLCLYPLGLYGRKCMTAGGSFVTYNAVNREVGEGYEKEDVSGVVVETYREYRRRGPDKWSYQMVFEMADGKNISFSPGDFRWTGEERLENLIRIRGFFPSAEITVEGADRLDDVIADWDMTEGEAALLWELFAWHS